MEGGKAPSPAVLDDEVPGDLHSGNEDPDEVAEVVRHLEHELCMRMTGSILGYHPSGEVSEQ